MKRAYVAILCIASFLAGMMAEPGVVFSQSQLTYLTTGIYAPTAGCAQANSSHRMQVDQADCPTTVTGLTQSSGNWALTGFGSGATVTSCTGGASIQQCTITTGTSPSANPTVVVTQPATFPSTPICSAGVNGAIGSLSTGAVATSSVSTSSVTLTFGGTPTNAQTYQVQVGCKAS